MITFVKVKDSSIPEALSNRIISWTNDGIVIDDTDLTPLEIAFIRFWLFTQGYRKQ